MPRAWASYLRERLESVAARHECLGRVRGTGLLFGLDVLERDGSPSKLRNKRIVNALASESRILIGYEGPHASILKLRPPMPFRPRARRSFGAGNRCGGRGGRRRPRLGGPSR